MKTNTYAKLGRQAELSKPELENLKHSLWEIDCPRVTVKRRSLQNPFVSNGSGFIKQVSNHQLIFKFYVNAEEYSRVDRNFQLGKTISDESYYDLIALDYKGRSWHCERILIDINESASGDWILQGIIPKMICKGEISHEVDCKGSSLEIRVFDNINIPCNEGTLTRKSVAQGIQSSESIFRNVWKFECCNLDFLLVKEDPNLLTINVASSQEAILEYLRERILETLQFILGYPINWTTSYQRIGHMTELTLCSPRQRAISSRFQAPFILGGYFNNEDKVFHHLFVRYLQHTINYDQPLHPIWAQLNAVYEASSGMFIDAHALTLSVAIESLLSIEFANLGGLTSEDKNAIEEALNYVENWNGKEGIKKRIKGSINGLYSIRADDKMRILVDIGAITEEQQQAWKKLRNTNVHDYQTHKLKHNKFVNLIFKINVLFYHLIFYAIGYEGVYMDISEIGFPIKHYPYRDETN